MGARSNLEKLPEELRQKLRDLLEDTNLTQQAVADMLNAEVGYEITSRSAVNRYKLKVDAWAAKNRQLREVAEAVTANGVDATNAVGKL